MSLVVPSQVVQFVSSVFPNLDDVADYNSQILTLNTEMRGAVLGLVSLVDKIPPHLVHPELVPEIVMSREAILTAVREAEQADMRAKTIGGQVKLRPFGPGGNSPMGGLNPVAAIRRAFEKCSDDAPTKSAQRLAFIKDPFLRDELEKDVAAVASALVNSEWKATTVLGGSIVEALLLWAIQERAKTEIDSAVSEARRKNALNKIPNPDPEWWSMSEFIAVSRELEASLSPTPRRRRVFSKTLEI